MNKVPSFNSYIEKSILSNWDRDALTDYKGATLQFHDVARKIEKLHILFENSGIQKGDKIALCGRNSSHWAVAFLATLTYGAVVVPIQHEFTTDQVYNIVNHSESKLLFVGDVVATSIDSKEMPNIEGIVYLPDFSVMESRTEALTYAREHLNEMFGHKYPKYFRKEHVKYHVDSPEELAMINYTSGTTGFSKGVMLPYRALWGNLDLMMDVIGKHIKPGSNVLGILPMAHMYGLLVEFIFEFCYGNHIFFLTRLPSPTVVAEAFAEVKPAIVISVPMIIEKIIRKSIFPTAQTPKVKLLMKMPGIGKKVKEKICQHVMDVMGGNAYEVMVGGAGLNKEVEDFLLEIGFPITMGYGTTETAPMITFSDYKDFVAGSCGTAVKHMEVKVLSDDPQNIPGEIVCRGINVMHGYYKNQAATDAVIDKDGWFHTGDLATMSEDGHFFIRGRIKNMLLGSNGQNVYPEEIEDKFQLYDDIEQICIIGYLKDKELKSEGIRAVIYPSKNVRETMKDDEIQKKMEGIVSEVNKNLQAYKKITMVTVAKTPLEMTSTKKIKRFVVAKEYKLD